MRWTPDGVPWLDELFGARSALGWGDGLLTALDWYGDVELASLGRLGAGEQLWCLRAEPMTIGGGFLWLDAVPPCGGSRLLLLGRCLERASVQRALLGAKALGWRCRVWAGAGAPAQ